MKYTIEKGIEIPDPVNERGRKTELRITLEQMAVGDSILVVDRSARWLSVACCEIKKKHSKQFIRRTLPEGVRVWRIT